MLSFYGHLKETVNIGCPPSYSLSESNVVCNLHRSIYGLKYRHLEHCLRTFILLFILLIFSKVLMIYTYSLVALLFYFFMWMIWSSLVVIKKELMSLNGFFMIPFKWRILGLLLILLVKKYHPPQLASFLHIASTLGNLLKLANLIHNKVCSTNSIDWEVSEFLNVFFRTDDPRFTKGDDTRMSMTDGCILCLLLGFGYIVMSDQFRVN